ncbi:MULTISPECIES: hypothetical protein [unclassified Aeromonas]|uniref:hypothetical protein n=1 Tax=unclassified Aeromonas TaxID=257493 RepID=UPI003528D350
MAETLLLASHTIHAPWLIAFFPTLHSLCTLEKMASIDSLKANHLKIMHLLNAQSHSSISPYSEKTKVVPADEGLIRAVGILSGANEEGAVAAIAP